MASRPAIPEITDKQSVEDRCRSAVAALSLIHLAMLVPGILDHCEAMDTDTPLLLSLRKFYLSA